MNRKQFWRSPPGSHSFPAGARLWSLARVWQDSIFTASSGSTSRPVLCPVLQGRVMWMGPAILQTRCDLWIKNHPKDGNWWVEICGQIRKLKKTMSGWWLGHPSEKNESQLGWWNSQYMGKSNWCSKPPTRCAYSWLFPEIFFRPIGDDFPCKASSMVRSNGVAIKIYLVIC